MYYRVASVDAIIIYLGDIITEEISQQVLSLYYNLKARDIDGFIEIIPSYTTLYIEFDTLLHSHSELFTQIEQWAEEIDRGEYLQGRDMSIPTYFDPSVGLDLERVASLHQMSIDEVVDIYAKRSYRVYTIGFAPGYAYMGSVDEQISTPRLPTPRAQIPEGSVAIANTQCAVYPQASPGGWNILGRTYIKMFDRAIDGLSYLRVGDSVRFEPICLEEYLARGGVV